MTVHKDTDLEAAARGFLRTGRVPSGISGPDLVNACDRLVRSQTQKSLPKAVLLAKKFVAKTRRHRELPLQIALRALAWCYHCTGKYALAKATYLEARSLVQRTPFDRAQIDKILIDVFMYLGKPTEARRRARQAIQTFKRLGNHDQVAKTRINFGNLLHRQDRHKEAREQYEAARKVLENSSGNELVLGLCYYNLANTLVQLFDFTAAAKYYRKARTNFENQGYGLFANECDYGLAWLAMLDNDYHVALGLLRECEKTYQRAGQAKGVLLCVLDRAEAYLGLNLFPDAHDAAREAERRAKRLDLGYESAKAAFFRAKAAFASGRDREVSAALKRARAGFRRESNQAFEAAVNLFELQASSEGHVGVDRIRNIRKRLPDDQLPLWGAIGDLQILGSHPQDRDVHARLERNPAVKTVPHLLAHWETIQGDDQFKQGRVGEAMEHWNRAAEVLDLVRAKLPPVELRATFLKGRSDPYARMIDAEINGNPARAAAWADRFKTVGAWAASGEFFLASRKRRQAEQSLAKLARQVSVLAGQVEPESGTRSSISPGARSSMRRLQREARDYLAAATHGRPQLDSWHERFAADLRAVAARQPIVQFHQARGDLLAFVHDGNDTRCHRFNNGARRLRAFLGNWQIQLNRSLLSREGCSAADIDDENRLFEQLGEYLWRPLEISASERRVLIVPDGFVSSLPWAAFRCDGRVLAEQHRLILAPSIQHHVKASSSTVENGESRVFIGDTAGLDRSDSDLPALLESSLDAQTVAPCRRAQWPDRGDWHLWHFTGHARYRHDNPFYSSLQMADGPLFGAELRLKDCRVELVTLAACQTAYQSVLPGEEATGLVRCLLEMGAQNVIGSLWAVADRSASDWMRSFYSHYLSNRSVDEAVRSATLELRDKYPSAYHWAPFAVYGKG